MEKIVSHKNVLKVGLTLIIPAFFIIFKPILLTLSQSIVLGVLFLVIIWWGTGWVHKDIASVLLLVTFICFAHTPPTQVLNFVCSENIVMIVAAYLLSQGIVNSEVAEQFSGYCLTRFCKTGKSLVVMSFVLCIVLLIIIPQPFPRVVLLAAIYLNYFKKYEVEENVSKVFLFSIFVASTVTSLLLLNGDVIVNYAAMGFGNINLSFVEWCKYMTLPTVCLTAIIAIVYTIVFKPELKFTFKNTGSELKLSFNKRGKIALSIMAGVVILWLSESYHGLSASLVALLGTIAMFLTRIISLKDFKVIKPSLLLFLTAEFSIGRSLTGSGVAEKIKEALAPLLPSVNSIWFLLIIALVIMGLHMIMGSVITALSFSVPMLLAITEGYYSPEFVVFFVLVIVCCQYILPFHHLNIMIGYGSGYYENKHTIKMGIALTLIVIGALFILYIPWWKLVGLI